MCNEQDVIIVCESFGVLIKTYFYLTFCLNGKVWQPGSVNFEYLKT